MTQIDTPTVEARCKHMDHCAHGGISADAEMMRALAADRDALFDALASRPAPAVTVKPLEWSQGSAPSDRTAHCECGVYAVAMIDGAWHAIRRFVCMDQQMEDEVIGLSDNQALAMQDCEDDRAQRIGSAYELSPQPSQEVTPKQAARPLAVMEFLREFTEHKFEGARNFSGPSPEDELEETTELGAVVAFQEDAQTLLQSLFPKRCQGGDIDAFNGDCLWCGAPLGGTCQSAALRAIAGEEA